MTFAESSAVLADKTDNIMSLPSSDDKFSAKDSSAISNFNDRTKHYGFCIGTNALL